MNIVVHPTIFITLVVGFFSGSLEQTVLIYIIIIIHELAHLKVAHILKVEAVKLSVLMFGANLEMKEACIKNPTHEILISSAGPLCNVIMALGAYYIKTHWKTGESVWDFFILANLCIFLLNLLPALPLDGGRILKAILTNQVGFIKAFRIVMGFTKAVIVLIFCAGGYLLYISHFNASLSVFALFLVSNLRNQEQLNCQLSMNEIIHFRQKLASKTYLRCKTIVAMYYTPTQKFIQKFSYNFFYIVNVLDDDMKILAIVTEAQIINAMIKLGSNIDLEAVLASECEKINL